MNISYLTLLVQHQAVSRVSSSPVGGENFAKTSDAHSQEIYFINLIRKYQQFLFLIESREPADQLILFLCYLFYVQLKAP